MVHKLKRIGLWLLILALCLAAQTAALEAVLRWMDVGRTTRFLLHKDIADATWAVPNRAFYQQFTSLPLDRIMTWDDLDFQAEMPKPPNTFRIFVFGGSAIYGPHTSSRILEVMLADRYPDVRFEVFNAACPGMNSHVMRAAARACAALEPDLFVVYMGNNEAVGPFGPTTALGQTGFLWRPAVIRTLIAMNNLRISQALRASNALVSLNLPDEHALMGMLPSMTDQRRALEYYALNLADITDAAAGAGIPAVLCTLAANKHYMGQVSPGEPEFNGLSINGIIRDACREHPHARLADVNAALAARSVNGLPGYEFFYDNVHFNFDGNYRVAKTMFETIVALPELARLPMPDRDAPPPDRDACARRLAWSDAAEFDLLRWQLQSFQDDYTRNRTQRRHGELNARVGDGWAGRMAHDYRTALSLRPHDLYLRNAFFRHALDAGMLDEAGRQQQQLTEYHPAARTGLRARGLLADRHGHADAAIAGYRACLAQYPDDPEALKGLAERLFERGEAEEARDLYRRFLRDDPGDVFAWCRLGQIQEMLGRPNRAENTYHMIIEQAPEHPLAHRLLDALMAETASDAERAAFWDHMLSEHPNAAEPYVRRALLHETAGDGKAALALLHEAAERAPGDPAVLVQLGETAYREGAYPTAEQALRDAVRLQPLNGHPRRLLIETLLAIGNSEEARREHDAAEALGLTMPPELRQRL